MNQLDHRTPASLRLLVASLSLVIAACSQQQPPPSAPEGSPQVGLPQPGLHPLPVEAHWVSSRNDPGLIAPMTIGLVETGAVAAGGLAYTVGGQAWAPMPDGGGNFRNTNQAWAYDPKANTWRRLADYPGRPVDHPALAAPDDTTLYLIGGMDSGPGNVSLYPDTATDRVWLYDIPSNTWRAGPPLPEPRGAGVARVLDGKIYYIGGIEAREASDDLFVLDPRHPEAGWSSLTPMHHRRDHLTAEVVGGKLYVIGGRDGFVDASGGDARNSQFRLFSYNEQYDPLTDTWTDRAPMPTARGALSSGVLDGRIIAFGGELNGQKIFDNTEAYDPATDTWQRLAPMITARHGTHGVTIGSWIYAPGGAPDYGVPTWDGKGYSLMGPGWGEDRDRFKDLVRVNERFGRDP